MADAAADRVWMDGSVKSVYKEFPFQCPSLSLFVVRDPDFIPPRDESLRVHGQGYTLLAPGKL